MRHFKLERQLKERSCTFLHFSSEQGAGVFAKNTRRTLPSNPSPPRQLINVRLLRDAASRLHRNVCYIGYRIALRPRQSFYLL